MEATRLRRAGAVAMSAVFVLSLFIYFCVAVGDQNREVRVAELAQNKKKTYSKNGTTIDYGNSSYGYIMVKQKAGKSKLKLKINKGDKTLTYDLNSDGEYEVFPLQFGDGKYKVTLFQQVKGTKYSTISSTSIDVKLSEKRINYLYPNQYVWYTLASQAVAFSQEICEGLTSDADKIRAVYDWVVTHISYDYFLALKVSSGYLPDIDQVLEDQKAICFGYSALVACMLRVQDIPTQLVIGYADKQYHAWNKVWYRDEWVRVDATFAASKGKANKYTEERSY